MCSWKSPISVASPSPSASARPDQKAMGAAVEAFLRAAGFDPSAQDSPLKDTPALVAEAWAGEFLNGYGIDPMSFLEEGIPASGQPSQGRSASFATPYTVTVKDIAFTGICPHHLLPYEGIADIVYVPGSKVVGFGALTQVVDALAHRLELQEHLTQKLAQTLQRGLDARGVLVRITARQSCLRLRGENQRNALTITQTEEIHPREPDPSAIRNSLLQALK